MKTRPILFNGAMVRAVLAGTKTQTRRALKPQPREDKSITSGRGELAWQTSVGHFIVSTLPTAPKLFVERCPYGQPGDRLWVREAWRIGAWNENDGTLCIDYRDGPRKTWIEIPAIADHDGDVFRRYWEQSSDDAERAGLKHDEEGNYKWEPGQSPCRWRPSIHMPRCASRITLEIVSVRVERLQEISEADAIAEGVGGDVTITPCFAVDRYRELWESINGPGSWDANPWVWVVEFKRVEQ